MKAHRVQPYLYRGPTQSPAYPSLHCRVYSFFLPVGLGHTFELILFLSYARNHVSTRAITATETISDLDSIRVRRTLGSVDELVRKTLCDRFHIAECRLARLNNKQTKSLVRTETNPLYRSTRPLTPMVRSAIAWFTRRRGDTSTA